MLGHSENTKVRDKYQESLTNSQKDSVFYLEDYLAALPKYKSHAKFAEL